MGDFRVPGHCAFSSRRSRVLQVLVGRFGGGQGSPKGFAATGGFWLEVCGLLSCCVTAAQMWAQWTAFPLYVTFVPHEPRARGTDTCSVGDSEAMKF